VIRGSSNIKNFLLLLGREVKYSHLKKTPTRLLVLPVRSPEEHSEPWYHYEHIPCCVHTPSFPLSGSWTKNRFLTNTKHCAPAQIWLQAIVHAVVCSVLKAVWGFPFRYKFNLMRRKKNQFLNKEFLSKLNIIFFIFHFHAEEAFILTVFLIYQ